MEPDDLERAWQAQSSRTRLTADADLLLEELRRKQRSFDATIFWRDVREVGVSLVLVPVWISLGGRSSPWTWYLMVPALLWIAGFMLADRWRRKRRHADAGESLRRHAESSLAQVDHQIWLLRNVHWWYLGPIALALLAHDVQVALQGRAGAWSAALEVITPATFVFLVFAGIYWVNQYAVRSDLEPRRLELEALLASLGDEAPGAGG